jgi:hypothetical protein
MDLSTQPSRIWLAQYEHDLGDFDERAGSSDAKHEPSDELRL